MKQKLAIAIITLLAIILISSVAHPAIEVVTSQNTQSTDLSDNFLVNTQDTQASDSYNFSVNSPNTQNLATDSDNFLLKNQNTQSQLTELTDNFLVNMYGLLKNFQISSKLSRITLCACDTYTDKLTIENTGIITETYKITFDKEFSKTKDMIITLNAHETAIIPNYIDTNCKEKSGYMETEIESTSGKSKLLRQAINSEMCNNIKIANLIKESNSTPCKKTQTKFILQNPLNFAEEYTIFLGKYDSFPNSTNSYASTILKPGEKRNVTINHNLPCEIYGKYNSKIKISTTKTDLESEIPVNLNIAKKYDYSLNISDSNEACLLKDEKIPFKIKNKENFENTFDLELSGNKYYSLENKAVTLKPQEEKTLYLIQKITSKNTTSLNLVLKAKSEFGEVSQTKNFNINIKNCYASEIKFSQNKICEDDNKAAFTIKNIGEKKLNFSISTKNPLISGISQTNISILPGETKTITLNLKYSPSFNAIVEISQENGLVKTMLPINITWVNDEKCFDIKFTPNEVFDIKNDTYSQSITIKNIGLKEGNYQLSTDQTGTIDFNEKNINLKPGQEITTSLKINTINAQNLTQVLFFADNKESGFIYTKTMLFEHEKKPILLRIKRNFEFLILLVKQNIKPIIYVLLVILLLAIIIISFLIAFAFKRNNEDKKKRLIVASHSKKRKR